MANKLVYSIIESPLHPDLGPLYHRLGLAHQLFTSERKAIQALKTMPPDIVVADFIYGYGNNYAGVNLGNLDVFLYSLEKYAPEARVIVLVDKGEREHVERLGEVVTLSAILTYPVAEADLAGLLKSYLNATSGS
jgi:hypothetical protein